MEGRGRNRRLVRGVRASERRVQTSMVGEGVRGSERGTDSVPTLLITVSLETERGLPLAQGNLLGPVAERVQKWKEGRGERRGEDKRKGMNG